MSNHEEPSNILARLAQSKSHIVYTDTFLNNAHNVQLNIYQNQMVCAMKMHHYLSDSTINPKRDFKFILREYSVHYPSTR